MAKKLYTVTIEAEVVVVAESPEEAQEEAEQAVIDTELHFHAVPMHSLPAGWSRESIPFGVGVDEDEDRTTQGWIDVGAAPEFTRLNAEMKARAEKRGSLTGSVAQEPK